MLPRKNVTIRKCTIQNVTDPSRQLELLLVEAANGVTPAI